LSRAKHRKQPYTVLFRKMGGNWEILFEGKSRVAALAAYRIILTSGHEYQIDFPPKFA